MDDESINTCCRSPGNGRKGQPHVYIPINRYKIKGIFDTGAARTVMSYSLLHALLANGVELAMEEVHHLQIRGISGREIKNCRKSIFSIYLWKNKVLPSCIDC